MGLQAQSAIKLAICILSALLTACGKRSAVWINEAAHVVKTQRGITTVDGVAFSGNLYSLYPEGDTAKIQGYLDGKPHGLFKEWHKNMVLKELRYFENGYKTGVHRGWYESGIQKFVAHFRNDLYEGNLKEWQENGELYRDFNYEAGQESGIQRMWESQGRIKANYEVRNGRKFGLAGSSNCLSAIQ
jgi:antitoxin component YwqK of YwqJK toxin-antitoxin module